MSYFARIKTLMTEKKYLLKSLSDLNFKYMERPEGFTLKNREGNKTFAEIKVKTQDDQNPIGFALNEGFYNCLADWEEMPFINPSDFVKKVTQRYAYNATIDELSEKGFSLASEEVAQDGKIRLVLRRSV